MLDVHNINHFSLNINHNLVNVIFSYVYPRSAILLSYNGNILYVCMYSLFVQNTCTMKKIHHCVSGTNNKK